MHTRLFDERKEITRARIIPPYKREVGTLCITNGVPRKAGVCYKPTLIHARRSFGSMLQVFITSEDVKNIFDIGLAASVVVKFCFNADPFPVLFGKNIHLMRRTPTCQSYSRARSPTVRTQNFSDKLFERKSGRT